MLSAFGSWGSLVVGVIGWVMLLVGIVHDSRVLLSVSLGGFWLVAVLLSVLEIPMAFIGLVGVLSAFSWDTGRRSVDLGRYFTGESQTHSIEYTHAMSTLVVGLGSLFMVYVLFSVFSGTQSELSVLSLTLGYALLLFILSRY